MDVKDVKVLTASSILDKKKLKELDGVSTRKERRAHERFPANLQARLFYGKMIYTGKVTNLSNNGMFIHTQVQFPVHAVFMMVVLLDKNTIEIPVKVRRTAQRDRGSFRRDCGIGVELLEAPESYLDFCRQLRVIMAFSC